MASGIFREVQTICPVRVRDAVCGRRLVYVAST
jgi:hypothetical protein